MLNCVRPYTSVSKMSSENSTAEWSKKTIEDNNSVKKIKSMLCCNQKCMFKLKKQDGSATSNYQEMIHQIREFYTTLYSDNVTMPPVDSTTRNTIPNVLISEVRSAIQTLKNGESAGERWHHWSHTLDN